MLELLKKSMFAAVGLAVMTRERAEEIARKIAGEAKLSESEGKQFVDELLKKSDETREAIEKMISEKIESTLKKLNIPTGKEMADLESRIRKIEIIQASQEK